MAKNKVWCFVFLCVASAIARELTDEEYYSLPPLFQLDDYDACLSRSDGLYCVGMFHLTSDKENPVYKLIEEHSKDQNHYNHTKLYRGYCVSERCPHNQIDRNNSLRFESCVQEWARTHSFGARLHELYYCHTHHDVSTQNHVKPDTPQIIFLVIVGVLILLNVIGTIYDFVVDDEKKKSKLLWSWSVRANWGRLTSDRVNADPRLAALVPLEGVRKVPSYCSPKYFRVIILAIVMWVHAGFLHYMLFVHNPRDLERMLQNPLMIIVKNGSAVVQVFVVITSFLFAYHMLLYSKNHEITFRMLPKCIFHRYIRFLAVDMQLYILAVVLTLALIKLGRLAVPILAVLFLGSCLLNAGLAYTFQWKSLLYVMNPENLLMRFREEPSFSHFYTAPWSSLSSSILGLLLANVHYQLEEKGFNPREHKWLMWLYQLYLPLVVGFIYTGYFFQQYTSLLATTVHAAIERPVFVVLTAVCFVGFFNKLDSVAWRVSRWRGWRAAARGSLGALALHWCAAGALAAAGPAPLPTSDIDIIVNWLATMGITYLISIPVTLLVEIPVQKFFRVLMT